MSQESYLLCNHRPFQWGCSSFRLILCIALTLLQNLYSRISIGLSGIKADIGWLFQVSAFSTWLWPHAALHTVHESHALPMFLFNTNARLHSTTLSASHPIHHSLIGGWGVKDFAIHSGAWMLQNTHTCNSLSKRTFSLSFLSNLSSINRIFNFRFLKILIFCICCIRISSYPNSLALAACNPMHLVTSCLTRNRWPRSWFSWLCFINKSRWDTFA